MFLDDDVILDSGCVRRLADGLRTRPGFAALAADYLGESTAYGAWSRPDRHIAMGATLFRRAALSQVRFRSEPDKCECQCCCDDLRRLGLAIAYLPEARAWHNRTEVGHAGRMVVVIIGGMTCPSWLAGCWRHSTGGTSSGFAVSSWARSAGAATMSR